MNYYFLSCKYTSYMCKPFNQTIVISEDPEVFVARNKNTDDVKEFGATFEMLQWKSTTKAHYNKLKKNNPGSDGYFLLKREDYSYIDNYCTTCIHKNKCPADHLDEGVVCPKGFDYEE